VTQWHHKHAQTYQARMKRRPTRAERRFDDILDAALKGTDLPVYKATQVKRTKWHRKKRKFKKQRIFENQRRKKAYIVDFYIPTLKLAIEIDGVSHIKQKEYDAIRSSFLATKGIKVIRYFNEQTLDFKGLKKLVQADVQSRIKELNEHKPKHSDSYSVDLLTEQYINNGGTITKCPIMRT